MTTSAAADTIFRGSFDDTVSAELLHKVMPRASERNVLRFAGPLSSAARIYGIRKTPARLAAFLATIAVETGELTWLAEIWGPTAQQRKYDPPSTLAKRLGNTKLGDGRRFKGRGLIMITGRANYTRMAGLLDLDCVTHPERLEDPHWASLSAGEWWRWRACNHAADTGGIEAVTRIVNGGLTHIERRREYYQRAMQALRS